MRTALKTAASRLGLGCHRLLGLVCLLGFGLPASWGQGGLQGVTPPTTTVLTGRLKVSWDSDKIELQAPLKQAVKGLRLDTGRDASAGGLLPSVEATGGGVTVAGAARSIVAALAPQTRSLWLEDEERARYRLDLPPLDIKSVSFTTADSPEKGLILTLAVEGLLPGFALYCSPQPEGETVSGSPILLRPDSRTPARVLDVTAQAEGAKLRILLPLAVDARLTYRFTLQNRDGSQARTVIVDRRGDDLRENAAAGLPARPAAVDAPAGVPGVELLEVQEAVAAVRKAGLLPVLCDLATLREVPSEGLEKQTVLRQGLAPQGTTRQGAVLLLGVRTSQNFPASPAPPQPQLPAAPGGGLEPAVEPEKPGGGLIGDPQMPGGLAVDPNAIDVGDDQGFVDTPRGPGGLMGLEPAEAPAPEGGLAGGGGNANIPALPADNPTPAGGLQPAGGVQQGQAVVPVAADPGVNIDPARPPDETLAEAVIKVVLQPLTVPGAADNLPGVLAAILEEVREKVEKDLVAALNQGVAVTVLPADRVLAIILHHLEISLAQADQDRALAAWRDSVKNRLDVQLLDRNHNGLVSDDVVIWFLTWLNQNGSWNPGKDVQVVKDSSGQPVAIVSDQKQPPDAVKQNPPAIALGPKVVPSNTSLPPSAPGGNPVAPVKNDVPVPVGPQEVAASSTPDKVRVPRLTAEGDTPSVNYRDALSLLTGRGLTARPTPANAGPTDPVYEQDPRAGSFVPAGSAVALTFGVLVPDLQGMSQDEAVKKLTALGLKAKAESSGVAQTDDPRQNGRSGVFGQVPPASKVVKPGTEVSLTLVTYRYQEGVPAGLTVPKLVGLTQANADAALRKAKLNGKIRETRGAPTDDARLVGQVIVVEQSDPAGTQVAADKVIEIVVVRYTAGNAVVPKLVGLTPESAYVALKSAKLTGKVREVRTEELPEGVVKAPAVAEQSEEAGTEVPRDRVIELVVISYVPKNDTRRVVPALVGLTTQAADLALRKAGLASKVRETRNEETVDPKLVNGVVVVEQSEVAGTRVAPDTVLEVVLVRYQDTRLTVPSLVGLSQQAAEARLKAAGISSRVRDTRPGKALDPKLAGQTVVGEQSEPAGTRIARDRTVELVMIRYAGQDEAPKGTVPNLVGMPVEKADAECKRVGLAMKVTGTTMQPATDPKDAGQTVVKSQGVRAGEMVPAGRAVEVQVVRYGPPTVKVPRLANLPLEEARTACKQAGLELRVRSTTNRETKEAGQIGKTYIESQNPAADTEVKKGAEVSVAAVQYVKPAPPKVTVPNLMGQRVEDAEAACKKLGLMMRVGTTVMKPTADKTQVNQSYVTGQSPQAGSKVDPNSTVDVSVVRYTLMKSNK